MKISDFSSGLFFTLLGCGMLWFSIGLPSGTNTLPGPGYWPIIIASGLILLSVTLTINSIRFHTHSPIVFSLKNTKHRQLLIIFSVMALFIGIWSAVGFLVPSILLVFFIMILLKKENPLQSLIYSITISTLIYFIFYFGMRIPFD